MKKTGCLVYIGDELLPIYAGIFHKPLEGCLLTNQFFMVNSTLSTGLPNRRRGCSTTLSRCLVWGCRVFKTKKRHFGIVSVENCPKSKETHRGDTPIFYEKTMIVGGRVSRDCIKFKVTSKKWLRCSAT